MHALRLRLHLCIIVHDRTVELALDFGVVVRVECTLVLLPQFGKFSAFLFIANVLFISTDVGAQLTPSV